jgi:hypothetical protein
MNQDSLHANVPQVRRTGAHRARRRHQSIVVRSAVVGGAAVCIGLLTEVNLPDANALSILLPGGNGNATQINILEGNIFRPQFGLGGNGGNTSNNRTIGGLIFGGGDPTGKSHVIALGGAKGNGNVTQINIASYNIFNPQTSIFGGNTSNNTTVSNVSAGNGNGKPTTSADSGGLGGLFGPALGAGNTTQLSLFSSNIFNPQFSLFGSNASQNTAVTNVSAANGNGSSTNTTGGGIFGGAFNAITGSGNTTQSAVGAGNIVNPQYSLLGSNRSQNLALTNQSFFNGNFSPTFTEGGGLGAFMVGLTGSGNSNQFAGLVSNIFNPQGTFGGVNQSDNEAGSNNADLNGNYSPNKVTSPGGALPFFGGNNTILGQLGSGNANQFGNGNGNIVNDQFRLFTALTRPQQSAPPPQVQQVNTQSQPQEQIELTNAEVGDGEGQDNVSGAGTGTGNSDGVLIQSGGQPNKPVGSSQLGERIATAVKKASDAMKDALKPRKPSSQSNPASNDNDSQTG